MTGRTNARKHTHAQTHTSASCAYTGSLCSYITRNSAGKSQSHSGKFENLLSQRDGYYTLTLLLTLTPALTGANQGTFLLHVKTRSLALYLCLYLALYLCLYLGSLDPIPIPCRRALTQAPS